MKCRSCTASERAGEVDVRSRGRPEQAAQRSFHQPTMSPPRSSGTRRLALNTECIEPGAAGTARHHLLVRSRHPSCRLFRPTTAIASDPSVVSSLSPRGESARRAGEGGMPRGDQLPGSPPRTLRVRRSRERAGEVDVRRSATPLRTFCSRTRQVFTDAQPQFWVGHDSGCHLNGVGAGSTVPTHVACSPNTSHTDNA